MFSYKVFTFPSIHNKLLSIGVIDTIHIKDDGNLMGKKMRVSKVRSSSLEELPSIPDLSTETVIAPLSDAQRFLGNPLYLLTQHLYHHLQALLKLLLHLLGLLDPMD